MNDPEKTALRRSIRAQIPAGEARAAESRALCERLLTCPALQAARTVAAFVPLPFEPDIRPLLQSLLAAGKRLALPCVTPEMDLIFRRTEALEALVPQRRGAPEPPPSAAVILPEEIDLILVPTEAVDRAGNRLGKGGGCYDRFLPRTRAVTLGVAFRAQCVERLPHAPHDVPLQALATADGILNFPDQNGV